MPKRWPILLMAILLISCVFIVGCGKSATQTSSSPGSAEVSKTGEQTAQPKADSELAELLGKAQKVDGIYYEMVMKSGKYTTTSKIWQQGKKMRSETNMGGMQAIAIVNPDKNLFITYMPGTNTAMAMDATAQKSIMDSSADKWSKDVAAADFKVTGSEEKNGYDCKVIEGTPEGLDDPVKMWLREDIGMPVAFETTMQGSTMTIEYQNYKLGKIEDSKFELPSGVQVTTIPKP